MNTILWRESACKLCGELMVTMSSLRCCWKVTVSKREKKSGVSGEWKWLTHHTLTEELSLPVGQVESIHPLQILLESRVGVRITVGELQRQFETSNNLRCK